MTHLKPKLSKLWMNYIYPQMVHSFVLMLKTTGLIATCASFKSAISTRCIECASSLLLKLLQFIKLVAYRCLLHEIQIMRWTTCTTDLKPAHNAIDKFRYQYERHTTRFIINFDICNFIAANIVVQFFI
jgi:hypothetical protein